MADSLSLDEQALRHRLEQAAQHWQQSAAVQIQQLPARLDSLLVPDQQRFLDVAWGLEGSSPTIHEQVEGLYGELEAMRADRPGLGDAQEVAELHARLEALEQAQQQTQRRAHGMGL